MNIEPGDVVIVNDKRVVVVEVVDNMVTVRVPRARSTQIVLLSDIQMKLDEKLADEKPTPAQVADQIVQDCNIGGDLTLRSHRDQFCEWQAGRYVPVEDVDMRARVMRKLRRIGDAFAKSGFRKDVIENLKAVVQVPSDVEIPVWLDDQNGATPAGAVIVFTNGILDVDEIMKNGVAGATPKPLTPSLFTFSAHGFDYDPTATCPEFLSFLEEVLPDAAVRGVVQEFTGLLLVYDTSFQKFMVMIGDGSNGKGVVSDVIVALVGAENVASVSLSRFGERFALWPLTRMLVNLVSEMPTAGQGSFKVAEDRLKAVVSGDPIEVEQKGKDIFTTRPTARLLFACNEMPCITDRSAGVWRRMLIIPFGVTFEEHQQDLGLAERLIAAELPGVFNWALEGLLRLRQRGRFKEPAVCKLVKAEHRARCAPEETFIREHVQAQPGRSEPIDDVYLAYRTWAETSGLKSMAKTRFGEAIRRIHPHIPAKAPREYHGDGKLRRQLRVYPGIQFFPDGVPDPEVRDD